ncbi:MAG: hypothetical protein H0W69_10600 [Gemmatimonadaceae bacterium]|nr:hypothetical protein [Gemmatimonadaceae bacterium]
MNFYLTAFALGAVGLLAMALSGFFSSHSGQHGHSAGHGGHSGHGGHGGHAHAGNHGHAEHGHSQSKDLHFDGEMHDSPWSALLAVMSPRVLFSVALGFGATGLLLQDVLSGILLAGAAVAGGVLFNTAIVGPLWNLTFRFASTPALSLESCLTDTATAVTNFNANGEGLIAVEVDGRNVQLLGTLQMQDREMGVKVRAGNQLRVEEVDAERNRCKVSLL